MRMIRIAVAGAIGAFGLAFAAAPDDTAPPAKVKKAMKMDQPMAGEMKKEGMTKGDMKKAADKKQREMKDRMKKEESAMPPPHG